MSDYITPAQFHAAADTADWRVIGDGACAFFATASLADGARLVTAIADLPGVDGHPPDMDVRPEGVTVRLLTRSAEWYGMSARDVELAAQISDAARGLGLAADPTQVQSVLVVPGAPDAAEAMPFWQVMLGYERRPDSPEEDLVDPLRRWPGFWFEQMKEPRVDGGGAVHIAVWLPFEQAQARIDAALAAGGRMVRDDYAPAWWTLADPAGNECDISTVKSRD